MATRLYLGESVSHLYVRYVAQKYGAAAIVFDGYTDHPTTKDATHLRRPGDCVGVPVHFASGMMIKSKMDEFLNDKAYKQQFIHYLSDNLDTVERERGRERVRERRERESWMHCISCKNDADILIVQIAVASARQK